MGGPELVSWLVVGVCGGVGCYCLGRLRRLPAAGRQGRALEAAMGIAMALMAAGMAGGPAAPAGVLVAVSAATVLGAALPLGLRARHRAHHAVEGAGMLYMALAMGGASGAHAAHGGHPGAGPAGVPVLSGALLVYCALYALRTAPRLVPAAAAPRAGHGDVGPGAGEDEVAVACRLALTLGMVAMVLVM
ncbi:DUF5134 domain-containing protein [Streptomyces triticirhizae]|uniref:DUF5134 domain-containing protein n=2 Tax=Streptomyces triticirhizae TaxID=2483353 RepID=A0A3M2LM54_9ACTN|nr:DUF5134 domain-containing protein [Streptomyces triticirhizae]